MGWGWLRNGLKGCRNGGNWRLGCLVYHLRLWRFLSRDSNNNRILCGAGTSGQHLPRERGRRARPRMQRGGGPLLDGLGRARDDNGIRDTPVARRGEVLPLPAGVGVCGRLGGREVDAGLCCSCAGGGGLCCREIGLSPLRGWRGVGCKVELGEGGDGQKRAAELVEGWFALQWWERCRRRCLCLLQLLWLLLRNVVTRWRTRTLTSIFAFFLGLGRLRLGLLRPVREEIPLWRHPALRRPAFCPSAPP